MKFSGLAHLALLASVVSASPTQVIEKRAAINDPCNIGYCTQNGG
jgi:pectate lyase